MFVYTSCIWCVLGVCMLFMVDIDLIDRVRGDCLCDKCVLLLSLSLCECVPGVCVCVCVCIVHVCMFMFMLCACLWRLIDNACVQSCLNSLSLSLCARARACVCVSVCIFSRTITTYTFANRLTTSQCNRDNRSIPPGIQVLCITVMLNRCNL